MIKFDPNLIKIWTPGVLRGGPRDLSFLECYLSNIKYLEAQNVEDEAIISFRQIHCYYILPREGYPRGHEDAHGSRIRIQHCELPDAYRCGQNALYETFSVKVPEDTKAYTHSVTNFIETFGDLWRLDG